MLGDVGQRVECGLRVARSAKRARKLPRLCLQGPAFLAQERFEQSQQRAPAFHLAPEVMDGVGVRSLGILDRSARIREDARGDSPQGLADGQIRLQGRRLAH